MTDMKVMKELWMNLKMVRIPRLIFFFLLMFLFSSCLTATYELTLDRAGSGSMEYSATVSTLALDIEKADTSRSVMFFPLTRDTTEQAALQSGGVLISSWNRTDRGSGYLVEGGVVFDSLEALSAFSGISIDSVEEGANTVFTLKINDGNTETDEESKALDIVRNSFAEDFIEIQTNIPGDIIRVEGATFTGSVVTFRTSVLNLLESASDVGFTVEYR